MTDKLDQLLEACDHPENFTDAQLEELLSDPENTEMYKLLRLTADAVADVPEPDIDAEWKQLMNRAQKKGFRAIGRRHAAAVAIVVLASIAVVAATIGIRHNFHKQESVMPEKPELAIMVQAPPVAYELQEALDSTVVTTVTFRNAMLADILRDISAYYDVEVVYEDDSTKDLRLYYHWNKEMSLNEVVDQLNKFVQINIRVQGQQLIVE